MVGEHFALAGGDVRMREGRRRERETGEGADDDGVPEGSRGGDECLLHGVGRAHGGGDDRGGAHAGFVGEETAPHAGLHGEHEGGADEAARRGVLGEGAAEDEFRCGDDVFPVAGEQNDAGDGVDDGHGGHAGGADASDAAQPAKQHEGNEQEEDASRHPRGDAEGGFLQHAGDGVALRDVADAEGGDGGENGEENGEPAAVQAALQGVHGPADDGAALVLHAIADGEQAFRIAGGHAKQAGEHAPEDGARSAGGDGDGDANDVAGADVGGQRDHERGEVGDVPLLLLASLHVVAHGAEEVPLGTTQQDGEINVRAQQAEEEDVPPQEPARPVEKIVDGLDHDRAGRYTPSFSLSSFFGFTARDARRA